MKKLILNTLSILYAFHSIQSYAAHNISGQIVDELGRGVKNASVTIHGSNVIITTDEDGRFEISESLNHIDELHIQAKGFNHLSLLLDEEQTHYQIQLKPTVIERIDVYATALHGSTLESATPISVLSDDELKNKHAPTLGETLKSEVGVHSSYYGPVSSSPIIRGLDGARVMITQNGLDAGDASRVGGDHVVATETSTVKQIEVLRGPATLFYGSGAIGGVINVVDNRVPREIEHSGEWQLSHNNGSDQKEASFSINGGENNIAYHIDAFWRESGDHKIPSEPELHVDESEEEHEAHEEEFHGKLENSAAKGSGVNVGASYITDNGFIGISFGMLDRLYGVPGHAHHEEETADVMAELEPHDEEDGVKGDLYQNRIQLLSEWSVNSKWLTAINTQVGITNYQHKELEGDEIGTIFKNDTLQFKGDLLIAPVFDWHGAITFDYKNSDFVAEGEEAFTPPSEYQSYAIGLLEEKHFNNVLIQFGARFEHVSIDTDETVNSNELLHEAPVFTQQRFNPVSSSLGLVWDYTTGYNVGIAYSHSERAPSASELFSFGPHIGTSTFEIGALFGAHEHEGEFELLDGEAKLERSNNLELSWRKFEGNFGFVFNTFYNSVDNFYYQADTGLNSQDSHGHDEELHEEPEHHEEGLPIFIYQARDAYFYGFEGQLTWRLENDLRFTVQADHIRGQLKNGDNLPRIPPARLGLMLDYTTDHWSFDFDVMHNFKQNKFSAAETETGAYSMVDFVISRHFNFSNNDMSAFVKVSNGLDETARVHSSFLKNTSVLPSRALTIGVRGYF